MKVIITGSNGFIGTWLIKELEKTGENEVVALVRQGSNYDELKNRNGVYVNEVDYESCLWEKCFDSADICIHLIGQMGKTGVTKEQYMEVNVNLTRKILSCCEKKNLKQFIFCSTPGVQGFGERLAAEELPYAPRNLYEETKVMAEKLILEFCKKADIKYTIIRPDFVYGPGDFRRIKMYKNIKNMKFVLTTSGKSYLHPTYVTDVVHGFIKSMDNEKAFNQIFNISADEDVTSLEYLETIAKCVDRKLIQINIGYSCSKTAAGIIENCYRIFLKREAFVSKNKIDFLALDHSTSNKKAKKLINYIPKVDINEGMQNTIEWCIHERLL